MANLHIRVAVEQACKNLIEADIPLEKNRLDEAIEMIDEIIVSLGFIRDEIQAHIIKVQ